MRRCLHHLSVCVCLFSVCFTWIGSMGPTLLSLSPPHNCCSCLCRMHVSGRSSRLSCAGRSDSFLNSYLRMLMTSGVTGRLRSGPAQCHRRSQSSQSCHSVRINLTHSLKQELTFQTAFRHSSAFESKIRPQHISQLPFEPTGA